MIPTIAVIQQPSALVIVLLIVLVVICLAPHAYYRGDRTYAGPGDLNWLWVLVVIVVVLWLLGVI